MPTVGIIRVDDSCGRPMAILVNYSCHPVVFGPDNLRYSADYPGAMAKYVEDHFDKAPICFFLQAAPGEQRRRRPAGLVVGDHQPPARPADPHLTRPGPLGVGIDQGGNDGGTQCVPKDCAARRQASLSRAHAKERSANCREKRRMHAAASRRLRCGR